MLAQNYSRTAEKARKKIGNNKDELRSHHCSHHCSARSGGAVSNALKLNHSLPQESRFSMELFPMPSSVSSCASCHGSGSPFALSCAATSCTQHSTAVHNPQASSCAAIRSDGHDEALQSFPRILGSFHFPILQVAFVHGGAAQFVGSSSFCWASKQSDAQGALGKVAAAPSL